MTVKRKRRFVPGYFLDIGMATALLALPAVALSQTALSLEQRVAKVERMLDSGTLIKLLQSVEELKAEVRELRGQLEQQQYSLSQMTDRQRELYLDVDRRLQRVETTGAAIAATAAATATGSPGTAPSATIATAPAPSSIGTTTGTSTSAPGTAVIGVAAAGAATQASAPQTAPASIDPVKVQQAYQTAFNLLKAGRYDQAAKAFEQFLAEYPASKFADNAQYWLGESYYVTRNFDNAMREFDKLITEHPDSQKLTHALLKVGYILDELGQKEKAREVLTDLTKNHPQSTAAGLAAKRLERMRSP